jgi:type I restriction enzyme S subunit
MARLRYEVRVNPSKSETRGLPPDTAVSFVPMDAISTDGDIALGEIRTLGEVQNGYTYFRDGDVVVAKITPCFENGKGACANGLVGGIGFGTTELHILRPSASTDGRYLYYLTSSHEFRVMGEAYMDGAAGQKRVPEDFIRNFRVRMPSLLEQRIIAAFLDRETANIDALVIKKERLIELLQEKRSALISHVVTRGLDPAVPTKESGVGWLGPVPAHWRTSRIRWIARMESGHTPDKKIDAYWTDCDIPWVSLNDTSYLAGHDYITETSNYVNALGIANSSARVLPARAVVFSRDATIGRCAITTRPMAVSQHFIAWLCGDGLVPEYLLFVLRAMHQELERVTMGATLKTIGMPDVKRLAIPVPPVQEQMQIAEHIMAKTARIDALVGKVREAIDKLKEYRAALITAAVTGKIDVRDDPE